MRSRRDDAVPITVVIPTRNRPAAALRAATSILAGAYPALRLLVVDQSDDDATRALLRPLARDPRVTLVAAPARGVAAARNLGIARSDTALVAFTDDDCEATPAWVGAIAAAFAADPDVGMVFGTVDAAPYDRGAGFIPAYRAPRAFTAETLAQKPAIEGIGANMAVRRATWEAVGGFDELLGTGGPLRAGEEADLAIRMLAAGHKVQVTPAAVVVHHGFRRWDQADATIDGYMTGLGAANAKMLRLGGVRALRPLAALAWRWLAAGPVVDLNHRPPRLARLRAFLRGARAGWRHPIDRRSGCFLAPERVGAADAPLAPARPAAPSAGSVPQLEIVQPAPATRDEKVVSDCD